MRDAVVRIPRMKYDRAKQHQKMIYEKYHLHLPLWRCMLDTENMSDQKKPEDPFRNLRRGFRL